MRTRNLLLGCLCLLATSGWAQTFSVEPDTFALELRTWMEGSKRPNAELAGSNFYAAWTSGAFDGRKDSIRNLTQRFRDKGYSRQDQVAKMLSALTTAISHAQVQGPQFDSLVHLIDQTNRYYDGKQLRKALATINQFLETGALYSIGYNRLHALDGQLKFTFALPADYLGYADDYVEETPADDPWGTDTSEEDDPWAEYDEEETDDDTWGDAGDGWETSPSESVEEEEYADPFAEEFLGPPLEGPIMHFEEVTLVMATKWDSVAIQQSNGDVLLITDQYVGKGGKFDWSSTGLPADQVWVDLADYYFNITKPELKAENVTLHYEGYIKNPVEGIFDFQSRRHTQPETARYPRFMSYEANVELVALGDEILRYRGGFGLNGSQVNSTSLFEGYSLLSATDSSGLLFRAKARKFVFDGDEILSDRVKISLYQGKDSIHHPALRMRYTIPNRHLVVQSPEGGFKNYPFWASYYGMEFKTDMIRWDLNADSLDISILNARNQVPTIFESRDYFDEQKFDDLAQAYGFHPLLVLTTTARKLRSNTFQVTEVTRVTGLPEGKIRGALASLREKSFIDYDAAGEEVTLLEKTWHLVRAKFKRKDFDNMLIPSVSPSLPNATLNRATQELTLRGIPRFSISEELDTYIVPDNEEITLLDNRNFKFNGRLSVGNFEFTGEDFTFNYDAFLVDLVKIDSIRFYVEVQDENGNTVRKLIDNQLVGINGQEGLPDGVNMNMAATAGTIYINEPDNKSGARINPNYPVFDASQGAIVYFDDPSVLGGIYDKSLYYVIPPFKIDSLADSDPGAISFPGTFYSSGILPPIQEKLTITEDGILGFRHPLPEEGLPLYDGRAKVYNEIVMDRDGLQGQGTLDYLSAHLESDKFTFYSDSVITNVGSIAKVEPGKLGIGSYPDVRVENYTMVWYPVREEMKISNNEAPLSFYNGTATLDGTASIRPRGSYGSGTFLTRGSEARSEDYTFTETSIVGRNAYFEIKSDNARKPAVLGQDVRLDFQLDQNIAEIGPEQEGIAAIGFPYAQYKTSIPSAVWSLDANTITMTKPDDVPIENSYFYSTRRAQDSIAFMATSAEYLIDSLKMRVGGIPYIVVADAYIIPDNNTVSIQQNARIEKLSQARLIVDTLSEYHSLFNGTIDIVSRHRFDGDATYELVNSAADTFAIKLDRFQLVDVEDPRLSEKPANTVSSGTIDELNNIVISPGMLYRGKVTMYADKPALELSGLVKLDFRTLEDYDTWIRYESSAESQKVIFDFNTSVSEVGKRLEAGLHFDRQTGELYYTFVTPKRSSVDIDFFVPSGNLYYDEEKYEFVIADPLKDTAEAWAGKMFRFHENTRELEFEGAISFLNEETNVPVQAAAKGKYWLDSSKVAMNTVMTVDFDIPKPIQYMMAEDLAEVIELLGAPEAARDPVAMTYLLAEIIGEQDAVFYDEASLEEYTPVVEASRKLRTSLAFTDIDLEWSPAQKAWFSTGSRLGLSNIQDTDLNATLEGYMEIRRTRLGEELNIFLKASPESWYFFQYSEGRLGIFSSNQVVNEEISAKSNALKAKPGELIFYQADISETLSFINRFRQIYMGVLEPYKLDDPVEGMDIQATAEEVTFPGETDDDDDDGF